MNGKVDEKANKRAAQKKSQPPHKLMLMITIVNSGKGELFADLLEEVGVNVQFFLHGRSSASTELSRYLGAGQDKDVLFSVVTEEKADGAMKAVNKKFVSAKGAAGISMTAPFSSMIGVLLYGFMSDSRELVRSNENGK